MKSAKAAAIVVAFAGLQPLSAEVIATTDDSFVTRDEAVVDATTKEVWLALITPGSWWNSSHTWSGDAANMTLTPQAGGCFCEKIPEDPDSATVTLEGSVEHMRVIHAFPERALRMRGGLGPLQSEPATGVLTVAISEVEDGTRIVWEYAVGGPMRFEMDVISKAVDGVMTEQLTGLAKQLGPVRGAGAEGDEAPEEEVVPEGEESDESVPGDEGASDEEGENARDGTDAPTVEEAFSDLTDE